MSMVKSSHRQKGAALLIVLLLVATLSFIALAATERTTLSAARSLNERIRSESLWYAFGAETLAIAALESAYEASEGKMSLDDPWATTPINAPLDSGAALLSFADDTACFNLNSLGGAASSGGGNPAVSGPSVGPALKPILPVDEFAALARNLGMSEFEGAALAEVVADWVDEDSNRRPQGAEDAHYGGLPSPYRTGNVPLASISELRAMKGVTRDIYAALKPYLCVHPGDKPSTINVNMLTEEDAPVLAAALETYAGGRPIAVQAAADIIAARPPGGYDLVTAFFDEPSVRALNILSPPTDRFAVKSQYVRTRVEIIYDTAVFNMTAQIALDDGGNGSVLSRRFGAEE